MKDMASEKKVDDELVELGEEVGATPRRKAAPVVALRVSPEFLESVVRYAEANGLTTSDVFRAGAERLIRGEQLGPTFVSGTFVVSAGGRIVQGSSSSGIGKSRRAEANPAFAGTISE